jgi:hypothetical protein
LLEPKGNWFVVTITYSKGLLPFLINYSCLLDLHLTYFFKVKGALRCMSMNDYPSLLMKYEALGNDSEVVVSFGNAALYNLLFDIN